MASAGRVVPWSSWREWQDVADALLADDTASWERGTAAVAAWRARGRLPLAVEATAVLRAAAANDRLERADESGLRMTYAMAVVRLVNGVTDPQQRGKFAAPVQALAQAAGLPRLLVDVRHEATHNELPSLPVLRRAAEAALEWLRTRYWDAQRAQLESARAGVGEALEVLVAAWQAAAASGAAGAEGAAASAAGAEGEGEGEGKEPAAAGTQAERRKARRRALEAVERCVPAGATSELLVPALLERLAAAKPADHPAWRLALQELEQHYSGLLALVLDAGVDAVAKGTDGLLPWTEYLLRKRRNVGPGKRDASVVAEAILSGPGAAESAPRLLGAIGADQMTQHSVASLLQSGGSSANQSQASGDAWASAETAAAAQSELMEAGKKRAREELEKDGPESWMRVEEWEPCAIGAAPAHLSFGAAEAPPRLDHADDDDLRLSSALFPQREELEPSVEADGTGTTAGGGSAEDASAGADTVGAGSEAPPRELSPPPPGWQGADADGPAAWLVSDQAAAALGDGVEPM